MEAKKNSLTALVNNLNVISYEDSLQMLARMTESQRSEAIDKMMKQMEEDEKKAEEASKLQKEQVLSATPVMGNPVAPLSSTSSWYFYNPTTVSFGRAEFAKRWGKRNLEDNWRRSEKELVLSADQQNEEDQQTASAGKKDSTESTASVSKGKNKEEYLKRIPVTADSIAASNSRITDAYYNAGNIYKEQLLNNQKSVETLEELLKRYPDNKYLLSTYYQLYRTYLAMNNPQKADYYKNLLLSKYPDSEYAKIIKNPDYAKDINASKSLVERFYTETYQLYTEGKYAEALANCVKAEEQYSKNYLMPQFAFLKALCIGRTQDINAFESALTQVVIKYPKSPVKEKAQEMLDMIAKQKGSGTSSIQKDSTAAEKKSKFVFNESGEYYWVLIVENSKGNLENFKIKLSEINKASFSTKDIGISDMFLDGTHQMINVKPFNGKDEAMKYYGFMKSNKDAYKDLNEGSYQSFIISADNFTTFYKDKNIAAYTQFFSQNFK